MREESEDALAARRDQVTRLLHSGAPARGELFELVYQDLRGIADRRMSGERAGHTLQATALVNEAWLRLAEHRKADWRDRGHFLSAASEAMRRILVDHARRVGAAKRRAEGERVTLGAIDCATDFDLDETRALAEAIERLEAADPRAAEVTRLRFFAGLSVAETALALDISERSVHREWTYARARLFEWMKESRPGSDA